MKASSRKRVPEWWMLLLLFFAVTVFHIRGLRPGYAFLPIDNVNNNMPWRTGPVGGIIASAQVGIALGFRNVISFDMGGTPAKASLIRAGEPTLAPGYYVGGYASGHPVMLPMIDVVEVGAGGGSIA